jgi:hypothetical protein
LNPPFSVPLPPNSCDRIRHEDIPERLSHLQG